MRILIAHNYYQQAGGEDVVFEAEAALLERHGHDVVRHAVHNDAIREMGQLRLAARTVWSREGRRTIADLVREHRPDIVHFHNTFPLISPAAYGAAREAGAAVVQTLHNHRLACPNGVVCRDGHACLECVGRRFAWPGIAHACYRGSRKATAVVALMQLTHRALGTWQDDVDLYISPSASTRRILCSAGLPADRVIVKPHFVDPDPGIGNGDGGYFIYLGRLSEEKGLRTLLKAWASMRNPPLLKIAGDGPLAPLVREAGPQVQWLGRLPMTQAYDVVGGASALIFPSDCYETFGRAIAEAFAKGTPVIASRLGTSIEMIEPGRTGELFDPGDALDLASRVNELAAAPADRLRQMRAAARHEYEAKYRADANYEQLVAAYNRALDQRHRRAPAADHHELGRWAPRGLAAG